jgi:DNA repair exonuclease SbcCD ATPase subunit
MINFKNLTVKNFMSVGNATQGINFDRNDLTLVLGENLDLGGDGSRNGTGKTTIINALSYALYGNALSNIRKDNLVNKTNGKNMLVSLDFSVDRQEYRIERGRKPNVLKFYVNNEDKSSTDDAQGDSRETQEVIERLLGLSHDMFKHILALNTYTEPFLSLKANDQRTIIEQLLGITQLSERADRIREINRETKESITQEEFRIRAEQEANKRIEEQIESLRRRQVMWQKKYDSDVADLVARYTDLVQVNIKLELQAHKDLAVWNEQTKQQETYNSLAARSTAWKQKHHTECQTAGRAYNDKNSINIETELAAWSQLAAYNQQAKDIAELQKLIDRCVQDENKEVKLVEKLRAEIEELRDHKCYACGQDFHDANHESVLASKEKALQEAALQALATNTQWIEHTDALLKLGELGTMPTTHYNTEAEAIRHASELAGLKQTMDAKEAEVDPFAEQLAELTEVNPGRQPVTHYDTEAEAIKHSSQVDSLLQQITTKHGETDPYGEQITDMQVHALKEVSYNRLNELVRLQEHQDFLLKLLTSKDSFIRKKIIDQNLSYLNNRLTHYLDRIGLPHTVTFQNDLTVMIEELGRELDFDNLSRGERNRLILSMSWAFRDVFESLYQPINLLFIDELIDSGLDTAGMESSLAILKHMSRERHKSVWLVSHRDELAGRVENILRVVKENGFTSYSTDVEVNVS